MKGELSMSNSVLNVSKSVSTNALNSFVKTAKSAVKPAAEQTKNINPILSKLVKPLDGGISSIGKESDLGKYLHVIG